MFISFNWLKQFVDLPDSITAEEVADKLKLSTVEVEGVVRQGSGLENIVIGKVLKCDQHPNADKLKVCVVDLGNEQATIVCGGSNVAEGMLTAVATNGAKVKWHGAGELVELKPATIRGVESNGMICAADEIGLAEMFPKKEDKEILDLSNFGGAVVGPPDSSKAEPWRAGSPLAVVLGLNDSILEIDNKSLSNRPDLWGHYGVAREVAALFNRTVKPYFVPEIAPGKEIKVAVDVEAPQMCPRYTAVALGGITVAPSPSWLQNYLSSAGVRPINNVVDITNYVMLELGQPTHAFDARTLTLDSRLQTLDKNNQSLPAEQAGPKSPPDFAMAKPLRAGKVQSPLRVVVRSAGPGEKFTTLDGKERILNDTMCVIANGDQAVALGGIMGGENSEIKNDTITVLFESANFDAVTIRTTSTKLGLRTEGSARWEKAQDPANALLGLKKLVALTRELIPGARVISNVASFGKERKYLPIIEIPLDFFAQKIGVEIPPKTIVSILERLGFGVAEKKKYLVIKVPSWRATKDISIAEDIVEEVLRIYGYHEVPAALPIFSITPPLENSLRNLERAVGDVLVQNMDYSEVYNYSFVSKNQIEKLGDDVAKYLELDNPISETKPFCRRALLPNMIENIQNNIERCDALRIFEIGKVFRGEESGLRVSSASDELLPRQDVCVAALYINKKDTTPFWQARRAAEAIVRVLNLDAEFVSAAPASLHPWQHPARTAWIKAGRIIVGRVYELHPTVAENFNLPYRVGVATFNLSVIDEAKLAFGPTRYHPLSPYPSVERDLAFVVDDKVTHTQLYETLRAVDPLVTKIVLFDVYQGANVPQNKKSMAYRLTLARPDRTLVAEEIAVAIKKAETALAEKFRAEVRK